MLRLAERLAVMAKATCRRIVIKMGMAQNYLATVVQKMLLKQMSVQFFMQCAEPRAVVHADPRAEQYAELCAVNCAESFAEKIAPTRKPLKRLVEMLVQSFVQ